MTVMLYDDCDAHDGGGSFRHPPLPAVKLSPSGCRRRKRQRKDEPYESYSDRGGIRLGYIPGACRKIWNFGCAHACSI